MKVGSLSQLVSSVSMTGGNEGSSDVFGQMLSDIMGDGNLTEMGSSLELEQGDREGEEMEDVAFVSNVVPLFSFYLPQEQIPLEVMEDVLEGVELDSSVNSCYSSDNVDLLAIDDSSVGLNTHNVVRDGGEVSVDVSENVVVEPNQTVKNEAIKISADNSLEDTDIQSVLPYVSNESLVKKVKGDSGLSQDVQSNVFEVFEDENEFNSLLSFRSEMLRKSLSDVEIKEVESYFPVSEEVSKTSELLVHYDEEIADSNDFSISALSSKITYVKSEIDLGKTEVPMVRWENEDSVIGDIVKQVKMLKNNESTTLVLKLNPRSLGDVDVKLHLKDGVVSTTIIVDKVMTKDVLEQALKNNSDFKIANLDIDNLSIEIRSDEKGFNAQFNDHSEPNQQWASNESKERRYVEDFDLVEEEEINDDDNSLLNLIA